MINQLTIIGLEYVGKSIATAIRSACFSQTIIGYDASIKTSDLFKENILDSIQNDLISAIKQADLIIITTPFDQYKEIFDLIVRHCKETVTIIEIASIKLPVWKLARETLGAKLFNLVPSHPIISHHYEKQDPPMPDLFAERPIILTPIHETRQKCLHLATLFWQKVGGEIELKTAAENDAILATISHIPQILAFTFINSLKGDASTLRYITEHFKEFTSIATQNPIIWSNICITNRQAILKELTRFEINLKKMKKILASEDMEILLEHFSNAKQLRETI